MPSPGPSHVVYAFCRYVSRRAFGNEREHVETAYLRPFMMHIPLRWIRSQPLHFDAALTTTIVLHVMVHLLSSFRWFLEGKIYGVLAGLRCGSLGRVHKLSYVNENHVKNEEEYRTSSFPVHWEELQPLGYRMWISLDFDCTHPHRCRCLFRLY